MKKTIKISIVSLLLCAVAAVGCRKSKTSESSISVDDAANVITYAVQGGSGGYVDQATDVAAMGKQASLKTDGALSIEGVSCGKALDSNVVKSYSKNGATANYNLQMHVELKCTGKIPNAMDYTGTYTGDFDGANMSSTNSGKRNWTITAKSGSEYNYSGTFTRVGKCTSKVGNKNSFDSDLTISTSNLVVNSTSYKVMSGSSNVNITCTSSNGNSYVLTGTITFNGNNTATLKLNNNTYTINF